MSRNDKHEHEHEHNQLDDCVCVLLNNDIYIYTYIWFIFVYNGSYQGVARKGVEGWGDSTSSIVFPQLVVKTVLACCFYVVFV